MLSCEIPDDQWICFFDQFSRDHVGWPVTIELLSREIGPQRIAKELPLQGISFDPCGSRPCTVQVGAGDRPDANLSHTIDLPLHLRLAESEAGDAGTIEIEPARGPHTLIHFHRPA